MFPAQPDPANFSGLHFHFRGKELGVLGAEGDRMIGPGHAAFLSDGALKLVGPGAVVSVTVDAVHDC
jgi:hypothetical protein